MRNVLKRMQKQFSDFFILKNVHFKFLEFDFFEPDSETLPSDNQLAWGILSKNIRAPLAQILFCVLFIFIYTARKLFFGILLI